MMSPRTSNAKVPNAYAVEAAKVLELLAVDAEQGLSAESAEALLVQYGPNELTEAPQVPNMAQISPAVRRLGGSDTNRGGDYRRHPR